MTDETPAFTAFAKGQALILQSAQFFFMSLTCESPQRSLLATLDLVTKVQSFAIEMPRRTLGDILNLMHRAIVNVA